MSFSNEWDIRYKEGTHMSLWPWSDLVSFVMHHSYSNNHSFRVLELGCGSGANIPFFKSLKIDYYGIDGSKTIIKKLVNKFPDLQDKIIVGDFSENIPFHKKFDLIVDRAAITHNNSYGIKCSLQNVYEQLKNKGKFIGIDWFSTKHPDYQKGKKTNDKFTKNYFSKGDFKNVGSVHFSNKKNLIDFFHNFRLLVLEQKIIVDELNHEKIYGGWNIVAEKS
jgi:SAM-dependent methyltransferase|tara:strand:+ start:10211 stop:10873 length:663 start_codon:yes stop_codon:yes gene_type:complete